MKTVAHNYVRDLLLPWRQCCSECLVIKRSEPTSIRATWSTKDGNILTSEPPCRLYIQDDEAAVPTGCAEEPEFMWLGRPSEDGAKSGPLTLEQFGVSGNNWRVVLDVEDDPVTLRVYVVTGVRSDIDAKTRAWIKSLAELVPTW